MSDDKHRYWRDQLKGIAAELSRLAIACDIDVSEKGVSARILNGDTSVCRRRNPEAFSKLQMHLKALFPLQDRMMESVGVEETFDMRDEVWGDILALRALGSGAKKPED